jgi:tungstate transport system substrate-binding protein
MSRTIPAQRRLLLLAAAGVLLVCGGCGRRAQRLLLATTFTVEDSGLLDSLRAGFQSAYPDAGLEVVVASSGEVLTIGRRGDADVLLTHAPEAERSFVAAGYGVERRAVMHNEFIVAGPPSDPAHASAADGAVDAFRRIHAAAAPFISRADDSGTHRRELSIWKAAGISPSWSSYMEAGTGMADVLRIADQRRAYALADLATFLMLEDKLSLELLYRGDSLLRNDYSVIVVKAARNAKGAELFADWITGPSAQEMIGRYGRPRFARPLFIGDAPAAPQVE